MSAGAARSCTDACLGPAGDVWHTNQSYSLKKPTHIMSLHMQTLKRLLANIQTFYGGHPFMHDVGIGGGSSYAELYFQ